MPRTQCLRPLRHSAGGSNRLETATRAALRRQLLAAGCAVAALGIPLASPALAGCNSGDIANDALLSSSACRADASGDSATAVGPGAYARGDLATAIGLNVGPPDAVTGATNVGANSGLFGAGVYSTAVGAGLSSGGASHATGSYSIAIGGGDRSQFDPGNGPITLNGAQATGFISIAIGTASQASGGGSVAFGLSSQASDDGASAYGEFSTAGGFLSTAVGRLAAAKGDSSSAFGNASDARANDAVALGSGAKATKRGAVALGSGSVGNVAEAVSVGRKRHERRIINVADAVAKTDAATLGQVQKIVAAAHVAGALTAAALLPGADADSTQPVNDLRRELTALRALVNRLQQEIADLKAATTAQTRL